MTSVVGLDLVSLLVYAATGLLSPFLVDIVTKRFASTQLKSLTLLAINLLTGLAVSFGDAHDAGTVFDWKSGLTAAAISFVAGAAGVFHFKNLNIIGADSVLAGIGGIGKEDPDKVAKGIVSAACDYVPELVSEVKDAVAAAAPVVEQAVQAAAATAVEAEVKHHSGLEGF